LFIGIHTLWLKVTSESNWSRSTVVWEIHQFTDMLVVKTRIQGGHVRNFSGVMQLGYRYLRRSAYAGPSQALPERLFVR
jgi:hypothetical protein